MTPITKPLNKLRRAAQLFAPARLKRLLWDREYRPGGRYAHCYVATQWPDLYALITTHAAGGSILDLGCGTGFTPSELPCGAYSSYVGIDISQVALDHARTLNASAAATTTFICADFTTYQLTAQFDVILLRESIYFYPDPVRAIRTLAAHLLPTGVIIAVVSANGSRRHYRDIAHRLTSAFPSTTMHGPDFEILTLSPQSQPANDRSQPSTLHTQR
jgi:SAM-dependent methyltransferase